MITLHKFNGQEFVLNANQIEVIEAKPDTTITLVNGKIYIVKETTQEVINLAIEYYRKTHPTEKYSI